MSLYTCYRAALTCALFVWMTGCSGGSPVPANVPSTTSPVAASTMPPVLAPDQVSQTNGKSKYGHVFVVLLENKDESATYSTAGAAYLDSVVKPAGAFLPSYYGTGHASLDNYISLISGQAPNALTSADCPYYLNFTSTTTSTDGQAVGSGCVFPDTIPNLADQLRAANIPWRSYDEDMGNDPTREASTCGHPALNAQDLTQDAEGPDANNDEAGDMYATRHNPFMYFHSIIDDEAYCQEHVVNAKQLATDLKSVATTPNFSFFTPNLCNDGHDSSCAANGISGTTNGGYTAIDAEMQYLVPLITGSPAFKQDGLLVIIFDEADTSDTSQCCGEMPGPNDPDPGEEGPSSTGLGGGGQVGAVLLSPFLTAGSTSMSAYNHYALLASVEDIFGLGRIGYAEAAGLNSIPTDGTLATSSVAKKTDVYGLVTRKGAALRSYARKL